MGTINFEKPEESGVDFAVENGGTPPGVAEWTAPTQIKETTLGGIAEPLQKNPAQKSDIQSTPEKQKEQYLERVKGLLARNEDFGIAVDYDDNIAQHGEINPIARQALIDMVTAGKKVVVVSSRGAKDVAQRVDIPGISIVGTLGWETLDENGQSRIHSRFKPFSSQITGILKDVRERFFTEQLHMSIEIADEPNTRLAISEGSSINLQRKGYNEEYPEGINSTWALTELKAETQIKYQKILEEYYHEAFDKYTASLSDIDKIKLQELCSFMLRAGKNPDGLPTLDVEIRPKSQIAKAIAIIQLMREQQDPKRQENFANMPYSPNWIFSGDTLTQDAPPMRAGNTANALTKGKRSMIGVWSRPSHLELQNARGVDFTVDGVAANAELLKDTAKLIQQSSFTP